jgi:hypothetical protein
MAPRKRLTANTVAEAVQDYVRSIAANHTTTPGLETERYCALGSLIALVRELRGREVVTRLGTLSSGRTIGGIAFTSRLLKKSLVIWIGM